MHRLALASLLLAAGCARTEARPVAASSSPVEAPAAPPVSASPPPAPERESVTFGHDTASIHAITSKESYGVDLVATATREDGEFRTSDLTFAVKEERRTEILDDGDEPRLRLVFGNGSSTMIHDGRESATLSPLSGHTYRVTLGKSGIAITDDAGRAVPREQGGLLARRFGRRDERRDALTRLRAKPIAIGERSEAVEAFLRADLSGSLETTRFGEVTATLKSTRSIGGARTAVFATHLQFAAELPHGLHFVNDLRGELLLRVSDATLTRADLEGAARMTGTIGAGNIRADGRAVMRVAHDYE